MSNEKGRSKTTEDISVGKRRKNQCLSKRKSNAINFEASLKTVKKSSNACRQVKRKSHSVKGTKCESLKGLTQLTRMR